MGREKGEKVNIHQSFLHQDQWIRSQVRCRDANLLHQLGSVSLLYTKKRKLTFYVLEVKKYIYIWQAITMDYPYCSLWSPCACILICEFRDLPSMHQVSFLFLIKQVSFYNRFSPWWKLSKVCDILCKAFWIWW